MNQLELETVKREKPRSEDLAKSEAEAEEAHKPVPRFEAAAIKDVVAVDQPVEAGVSVEAGKKRKRRRKKKKGVSDAAATDQAESPLVAVESADGEIENIPATADYEGSEESVDESAAKPKKRKRRRGRKGPKLPGDVVADSITEAGEAEIASTDSAVTEPAEVVTLEVPQLAGKAKRPRPARTRKKTVADVVAEIPEPEVQVVVDVAPAAVKPRRRVASKKVKAVETTSPEVSVEEAKPAPRARSKKKVEEIQ